MWRDPLDELIEDLERAMPPSTVRVQLPGPPRDDLQWAVGLVIRARTEEEKARAHQAFEEIFRPGYKSRFI